MKKSLIGQILFVAILLSLWVGSTTAVTVINDCNFNANITGVYYVLGQNLTCSGSEHGINIGASNITIDGYNETDYKHYWIDGGSPAGCDPFTTYWSGIYDEGGYDHVTIRNLEILHFCNGIFLRDTALNENYTIENCKVHDIGIGPGTQGINLKMLNHGTVKSCEIYNVDGTGSGCESGGDGIFLYDGRNNTFTCNNIHHNRKGGIFIKMMPKYTNISHNHLWKNGQAGAGETGGIILRCMLCNYNLIAFNNASNNYGDGIFIGGLYNTIEYNLVINNSDNGIDIGRNDGGDYNELYSNTVCNNGGKDIRTCGGTDPSSGCYGNTGDEDTCDTTENYADEGATGCTYLCSAGVIADFFAEPTEGTSPLEVVFTDRSKPEGYITSWLWDFCDGNTSDEQNPTHTYSTLHPYSYYDVSLTVTGSGGASDTVTMTDYIKVWKPEAAPNANFLCPKAVGDLSVSVQFTDKSMGEVTSWLWDFGDGYTNTTQNPEHHYSEEGIYNVSLTVIGPGGSSIETKFECVRVGSGSGEKRPLVDAHFFASERNGAAPLTVKFTDFSKSEDEILLWRWDFGDGYTSNEQNPTHTYNSSGSYNVSLEVTNTESAKAKETRIRYIVVSAFSDYFDTGAPDNPYPSIFGTHNGTIILDRDITVNRIYTYPCKGTGGHTEYVRIWNSTLNVSASWDGYKGDWHNISFDDTFTLNENEPYYYEVRTGSYPQIIHAKEYEVEGGNITCTEFTDANGKRYTNWIPAIRLFYEEQ